MASRLRSGCDKAAQRYVLNLASSRTGLVLIAFALLAWSLVLFKIGGALHRSVAAFPAASLGFLLSLAVTFALISPATHRLCTRIFSLLHLPVLAIHQPSDHVLP